MGGAMASIGCQWKAGEPRATATRGARLQPDRPRYKYTTCAAEVCGLADNLIHRNGGTGGKRKKGRRVHSVTGRRCIHKWYGLV